MVDYDKIAYKIFNVLKGHGFNVQMYADDGMQTTEPEAARRFFVEEPNFMVTLQDEDDEIKMNKNANLALEDLRSVILQLKMIAERYMLEFTLRVFGNDIVAKDYAYQAESKEKGMEGINEASLSRMFGSKKTSYQTLEDVKMIVRHKVSVSEEQRGARSRNISAIFLECNGERYQFPYTNLAGARAMARHMSMGGATDDIMAEHIVKTTGNMLKLKEFVNYTRKNKLVNESSQDVVDSIMENMKSLRKDLERIRGVKTYESVLRRVSSTQVQELSEDDFSDLRDMFTVKTFDEKMADILPIVGRIVQEKESFYRRIEEASTEVQLNPRKMSAVASMLDFSTVGAKVAHELSEMAARIHENDELVSFLSGISRKLCTEGDLSDFEKNIVKNVLECAIIREFSDEQNSELTESKEFENSFEKYTNIFL